MKELCRFNKIYGFILSVLMLFVGYFNLDMKVFIIVVVSSCIVWGILFKLYNIFDQSKTVESSLKSKNIVILLATFGYSFSLLIFFIYKHNDFNMLTYLGLYVAYLIDDEIQNESSEE